MKTVELHLIQSFPPSLLNRDDSGSPKEGVFGGVRRARLSSQCLKRAIRDYFRDEHLLEGRELALRTTEIGLELGTRLEAKGREAGKARALCALALGGLGLALEEGRAQYLLFLGEAELTRLAGVIDAHWEELEGLHEAQSGVAGDDKQTPKERKRAAKKGLPTPLVAALLAALDGGKAADLALFGRMLADLPERNVVAACSVSHALSTHAVAREFDFFTAVDDLHRGEQGSARMLGTGEFNAATYYRYALLDLEQLTVNLQGDQALARRVVEAFLLASVFALPGGKQKAFAAHSLPGFIGVSVRERGAPRSLVGAFERPVRARGEGLEAASVAALEGYQERLDTLYGASGKLYCASLHELRYLKPSPNLQAMMEAVMGALEGKAEVEGRVS